MNLIGVIEVPYENLRSFLQQSLVTATKGHIYGRLKQDLPISNIKSFIRCHQNLKSLTRFNVSPSSSLSLSPSSINVSLDKLTKCSRMFFLNRQVQYCTIGL